MQPDVPGCEKCTHYASALGGRRHHAEPWDASLVVHVTVVHVMPCLGALPICAGSGAGRQVGAAAGREGRIRPHGGRTGQSREEA